MKRYIYTFTTSISRNVRTEVINAPDLRSSVDAFDAHFGNLPHVGVKKIEYGGESLPEKGHDFIDYDNKKPIRHNG